MSTPCPTLKALKQLLKLLVCVCAGLPAVLAAQQYSIDWYTIDGGGGTSSGGNYTLTGTIGQPDAGFLSGGDYSLLGGFWGAIPVQQVGAPTLIIQNAGAGNIRISWTPPDPGCVLQVSDTIFPAQWNDAPSGSQNPVVLPAALQMKFYRLRR